MRLKFVKFWSEIIIQPVVLEKYVFIKRVKSILNHVLEISQYLNFYQSIKTFGFSFLFSYTTRFPIQISWDKNKLEVT